MDHADVALSLAAAAQALTGRGSVDETIDQIVHVALQVVPGAEAASMTQSHPDGSVRTLAATQEVAPRGSSVSCPLFSRQDAVATLNIDASTLHAFDEHAVAIANLYAMHASIALEAARVEHGLRATIKTNEGIGNAVGILMERHRLTAEAAERLLRENDGTAR